MPRYDYITTPSAPKDWPIRLLRADLVLEDGGTLYVPDNRNLAHGWGVPGATHIVGEEYKALPVRLSATWFSYVEDRFYAIDTDLPEDVIAGWFARGIDSPRRGESHDFDRIVFGFGPEGEGAVWLSAHNDMIDAFRFRAPEVEVDWTQVIDNPDITREAFIALVLEDALGPDGAARALAEGYTPGTWPRRQQVWPWALEIDGAKEVTTARVTFLNGEQFHFLDDLEPNTGGTEFAAPDSVLLHWTGPANQKRSATVTFDAAETLEAFERLAAGPGPLRLRIELSASGDGLAVTLDSGDMIYEFEGIAAEIFDLD